MARALALSSKTLIREIHSQPRLGGHRPPPPPLPSTARQRIPTVVTTRQSHRKCQPLEPLPTSAEIPINGHHCHRDRPLQRQPFLARQSHHSFGAKEPLVGQHRRSYHSYGTREQLLTTQEVATALRPFYFVVHPDRFWRYPTAKDRNEDSLKLLNEYIDDVMASRDSRVDRRITFFLRQAVDNDSLDSLSATTTTTGATVDGQAVRLKEISINLLRRESVNRIVHKILSECQLSTDYLRKIGKQPNSAAETIVPPVAAPTHSTGRSQPIHDFWIRFNQSQSHGKQDAEEDNTEEFIETLHKRKDPNLTAWLRENREVAMGRLERSEPVRQEFRRLADRITDELGLRELIWRDCQWGVSHVRAALKGVDTLSRQHRQEFRVLEGRTLVFGRQTGVSFDGHVVLNIEDVRHNWLELIRRIDQYDEHLRQIPVLEGCLSGVLRGVQIEHRKFRPSVPVKSYTKHVSKLTGALVEHIAQRGLPAHWPPTLSSYQLVVECEAGPLMVSPTGQFIVPASCPAHLFVDFMSQNLFKSRLLRDMYLTYKSREDLIITQCVDALSLHSIEKDDNVTPDLMIQCCQRLIANRDALDHLRDCRLRVSHYYSVLLDGEVCIPWSFNP